LLYAVYAVSLLSGAVLMGLEMVGSRVLAPLFGSSIFVWGSLIGIVLAALSLGYYIGGYLADRYPALSAISWVLLAAGLWIGAIPVLSDALLPGVASGISGSRGPLLASLFLFFVPSVFLATVSPWCVRLCVKNLERAGRAAGILYAVSNAGSIAGTFVTSFYLVPRIGVEAILMWMASLLIAAALLLAVFSGRKNRAVLLLLAVVIAVPFFGARHLRDRGEAGVIYETQSLYHHIYVVDDGDTRLLKFDRSIQSGIRLDDPFETVFAYTDYLHLALTLKTDIEDVLMIGLGAGTVPKRFLRDYPGMNIECVELDPAVISVAREYFGFPGDDRIKVHAKDGRTFLSDTAKTYDLIIVDAYYADAIPFHLATVEFYELALSKLRPGGVLASNFIGALEGPKSDLFRSMLLTLQRVFHETYVFPVGFSSGTETVVRNIEVFAVALGKERATKMTAADIIAKAEALEGGTVLLEHLSDLASELYDKSISREGAVVLTDDYAPVDSLLYVY
jgi:spermidine synthase